MNLTQSLKSTIRAHCLSDASIEQCGFIIETIAGLIAHPCENVHPDRANTFWITSEERAIAGLRGKIVGVYHSHRFLSQHTLSIEDVKAARQSKEWWVMYNIAMNSFTEYDPKAKLPYTGRPWSWTFSNCFSLWQDYYAREYDHRIDDFYLSSEESYKTEDVGYVANLPKQGMYRVKDGNFEQGDLFIIDDGTGFPNHAGILVEPNRNIILHHRANCLSGRIIFAGDQLKTLHSVWRRLPQ